MVDKECNLRAGVYKVQIRTTQHSCLTDNIKYANENNGLKHEIDLRHKEESQCSIA